MFEFIKKGKASTIMKLHLIVIATSIPLNAYAAEAEDAHSFFYNHNYGSSYINASNLSPTTIVGPHLRLTSGTFGLTGTYTKKELGINLKKYQFGIFNYKNNAYGSLWSQGTGSSDALFDNVSTVSRVALKTNGTGISLGMPEKLNSETVSEINFFLLHAKHRITNFTETTAGAINTNETSSVTFKNLTLGYGQRVRVFQRDSFIAQLHFSKAIDLTKKHYKLSNSSIGLSLGFNLNGTEKDRKNIVPIQFKGQKLRVFSGVGTMFTEGTTQNTTDDYSSNYKYSSILSPTTKDVSIRWVSRGEGRIVYNVEIEKKSSRLDQKMQEIIFSGKTYSGQSQAHLNQSGVGFRADYKNSDRSYLTMGSLLGHGTAKSITRTNSGTSSSIKKSNTSFYLINLSVGIGQIFPLRSGLNLLVETSLNYIDGTPFGVNFRSHEFTTRIGLEFPLNY